MPFRVLMDPATLVLLFKVWICITRLLDSIKNQYRSWKTSVNISRTPEFCKHKDFLFSEAISTTTGMFYIRVGNCDCEWWVLKMGRSQSKEKAIQGCWELPGASSLHKSRWHDGGRAKSSSRTSLDIQSVQWPGIWQVGQAVRAWHCNSCRREQNSNEKMWWPPASVIDLKQKRRQKSHSFSGLMHGSRQTSRRAAQTFSYGELQNLEVPQRLEERLRCQGCKCA